MIDTHHKFWSQVLIGKSNECWPWTGAIKASGHGVTRMGGRSVNAHRAAFILANGSIREDQHVCHSCDNPPCCNPAHLWLGSHSENMLDSAKKLRKAKKLSPTRVMRIKALINGGRTQMHLSRLLKINQSTISRIANGKYWGHLM